MVKQYFFLILLLGFILVPVISVSAYNSGFQPVYQPPAPPGGVSNIHDIGNVTSVGCAAGQILKANASAIWACAADDTGAGGETNTASSSGVGYSLVLPKLGVDLPFRGIFCAGDLSCSSNSTDVRISYTSTAGSGNVTNLNDAGDVVLTSPSIFSILYYNGVNWIDQVFKLNSKTCSAGQFVSDVNNQTGAITCSTPSGSGNMTVLGDGGDVTITSPAPLSVLYYVGSQWIDKIFSVNTQSASNDFFVTGINNQTGVITTNQFSVNTQSSSVDRQITGINNVTGEITRNTFSVNLKTCSGTDKVSAIDNSTGNVICTADSTASNVLLDGSKHTDTIAQTASRGSLIVATDPGGGALWNELVIGASNTYLKSDGTDASWQTVSASGGATSLAANVTQTSPLSAHGLVFTIPLTANSGNSIKGMLVAQTNTAGVAVQGGANVTSLQSRGWCHWITPLTATTEAIDNLVMNTVLTGSTTDTGEIVWLPSINVPQPIIFDCTITSGATPGNLKIWIQPEVAGSVTAKAGSMYIKTP